MIVCKLNIHVAGTDIWQRLRDQVLKVSSHHFVSVNLVDHHSLVYVFIGKADTLVQIQPVQWPQHINRPSSVEIMIILLETGVL